MSVTDELREWTRTHTVNCSDDRIALVAIAEHIDAALEEGYIELPKDADGETIRIGERVQRVGNDPSTVSHMSLADDGWRVFVKYDNGLGTGSGKPKSIRHIQPDSWERIIKDAGELGYDWFSTPMGDNVYAEKIGKLVERCKRLAREVG